MQNPLVSIIIPCYNAEKFITETIQSVLNQTFSEWELIILNDGSTDNSENKILQFQDKRIRYIPKHNTGVADTRNKGIELARGKYIAFLDADDLWKENNLEKKINLLENSEYPVVFSDCIINDFENNIKTIDKGCNINIKKRLLEFIPNTIPVPPSNLILKKELSKKIGGFDTHLSTSADWDFAVRLSHITPFGYIPEPLVIYRIHPNQMHKNIPLMEKDMLYAFKKAKTNNLFENKKHYRYCTSKLFLILAGSYWKYTSNYLKIMKFVILSFLYNPTILIKKLIKKYV